MARADTVMAGTNMGGPTLERPADFSGRDWKAVMMRVWTCIGEDNISLIAAGCAFYSVLALFPGITALVLIYGLVADPAQVSAQLAQLEGILPADVLTMIKDQMTRVAGQNESALGWGLVVAVGFAFWSASAGMKAIFTALNIAYKEREKRNILVFNLLGLLFTVMAILAVIVGLVAIVVVPAVLAFVGLGGVFEWSLRIARWPLLAVIVALGLAVLYRYGPSRATARWEWLTWGSTIATLIWLAASIGFAIYVASFASYNATYGSLGAPVVLLMWFYITAFAVLLGAEINGELEHQTSIDTTTGPSKPMGRRGAYMADHVAGQSLADNGEPRERHHE